VSARFTDKRRTEKKNSGRVPMKSRQWILEKKERRRRQGRGEVRSDTKYTGRKRRPVF
jgi:18S rRNA (guanine1575-N7)-methyltransferase